jgi:hypothetical protein
LGRKPEVADAKNLRPGIVTETLTAAGSDDTVGNDAHRLCPARFPPDVIRHAVWLYLRLTLSYRDVEELLAERGLDVSYETIRR